MQYLCEKQLTAGGVIYRPGELIPDGVILPGRSGKLIGSGHLSEVNLKTKPGASEGTVPISVKSASDGENAQIAVIPAKPEEIQQVFSILQMSAEDGSKAVLDIKSENVLILLHAADSRKTIKNAVKELADKRFPTEGADT